MKKKGISGHTYVTAPSPLKRARARSLLMLLLLLCGLAANAQTDPQAFKIYQLSCPHVAVAVAKYNDTLSNEFRRKNIAWPPKDIYIRAFKSQNEMELWARPNETVEYKLVKTYHICAISGLLGPKRYQG